MVAAATGRGVAAAAVVAAPPSGVGVASSENNSSETIGLVLTCYECESVAGRDSDEMVALRHLFYFKFGEERHTWQVQLIHFASGTHAAAEVSAHVARVHLRTHVASKGIESKANSRQQIGSNASVNPQKGDSGAGRHEPDRSQGQSQGENVVGRKRAKSQRTSPSWNCHAPWGLSLRGARRFFFLFHFRR